RVGQGVQVWYGPHTREAMPWHGKAGTVVVSGRGRPRNHLVRIDGQQVIVPAGNLRTPTGNQTKHTKGTPHGDDAGAGDG
ncbi:MAG TPA: hypothetical protein PLP01_06550, partial [Phycisphaerae bacterium]|nr:hypothetical protein [Phycisphaerae bacterium]